MKILIVSDTHRMHENYLKALEQEKPLDLVIHCGDAEGSEYLIEEAAGCPLEIVLGNNDFFSKLPRELELELCGKRVWITHGHNYGVSTGTEIIKDEARSRHMDIVLFGHTHRPVLEQESDLVTLNPGSISYPRQEKRRPSYAIMEQKKQGEFVFCHKFL